MNLMVGYVLADLGWAWVQIVGLLQVSPMCLPLLWDSEHQATCFTWNVGALENHILSL